MLETRREQLRRTAAACRGSRQVYEDDQAARNAVIVLADQEDWELVEIAAETHLEPSHVLKIIAAAARRAGQRAEGQSVPGAVESAPAHP